MPTSSTSGSLHAQPTIGVLIPTRNAGDTLDAVLDRCSAQPVDSVLVVDSGSRDRTVSIARQRHCDVLEIGASAFNHGLTRELGRKRLGTDIVVMLTQDAVPIDTRSIATLVQPLVRHEVALAYGRQVPRDGAGGIERFLREFNYPRESERRSLARQGSTSVNRRMPVSFFSNAFSAYSSRALDNVGGFPRTPSNEDAIVASRMLRAGYELAYVAEAAVTHSHAPRFLSELRRNYDSATARKLHPDPLVEHLADHARQFAVELLKEWKRSDDSSIADISSYLAARSLGTLLGTYSRFVPRPLRIVISNSTEDWPS